ncbi:hypothetical protein Acor_60130 [Acrocarpospora corrugata]|uniref:Zinc finger CGNR domain-containing protein n=1 Tax=Acrocarpospora corrugata TaxID=35763 RepID=A0A5M3W4F6_9ACTN|nr:CGNR zinc finger domain-containing protein [Acrocarpospora corrugata]GES03947.1 hypothetical protein Acor_60130 [Acrocarpospora corrugata]
MNFNSHSDMIVAHAVAVVNALTPGERRGRPYQIPADRRTAVAEAVPLRREITDAEAAELAGYALDLRAVFEAVAKGDLDHAAGTLNRLLTDTRARPHLSRHDGEPWHVHFHGADGTFGADYAASCATGLAIVLGSDLHDRLGVCTADRCDRVYVDVSRNGTRRFCSTACQNRVKTAAFRART